MQLPQVTIKPKLINWDGLAKRFMNPGELEILCQLVASVKPKVVVEFGINTGRTAKALLREVPSIEHYVGIDVHQGYSTPMMVQRREVPAIPGEVVKDDKRVELIVTARGSHDLTPQDIPMFDVAFIDGDHSRAGVEQDTYLARSRIRKGGMIIWHDYNDVRDRRGKAVVDVKEVLHDFSLGGADIRHVKDTWLAYELVQYV